MLDKRGKMCYYTVARRWYNLSPRQSHAVFTAAWAFFLRFMLDFSPMMCYNKFTVFPPCSFHSDSVAAFFIQEVAFAGAKASIVGAPAAQT